MTVALLKADQDILDFLKRYIRTKKSQLEDIFKNDRRRIKFLIKNGFIKEDGEFVEINGSKPKVKNYLHTYKALYILGQFIDDVQYHSPGKFPVIMSLVINSVGYDVVIMIPGQELITSQIINSSSTDKFFIIIETGIDISKVSLEKEHRFFTVEPLKFYTKEGVYKNG